MLKPTPQKRRARHANDFLVSEIKEIKDVKDKQIVSSVRQTRFSDRAGGKKLEMSRNCFHLFILLDRVFWSHRHILSPHGNSGFLVCCREAWEKRASRR